MSNALGIDLGSSKVAAVIVDEDANPIDAVSILLPERSGSEKIVERDPQSIFTAVDVAVKGLNSEARKTVGAIGVCGQMHGVLLWNDLDRDHSPLITWEDRRADDGSFLTELRRTTGIDDVHSGYGAVTLAWLNRNDPTQLVTYDHAGTIMDYLVARCCASVPPLMDPTNAAGWGFFDVHRREWNMDAFEKTGAPKRFLPTVKPTGTQAGSLCQGMAARWGLPENTPVSVACGDNPAAVFACRERLDDGVFLNVGTGSQLAVVVDEESLTGFESDVGIEVRPFLPGRYLVVTASVCGGQSFQWLVETVERWLHELGMEAPSRDRLFEILNDRGSACTEGDLPEFLPFFKAERHHPGMLGSISGIGWSNMSLGGLARSLARGMIESLWNLFPAHLLHGKTILVATGNGIRRSSLLRAVAEEVTGLSLVLPDLHEEAATGAARLARYSLRSSR